MDASIVVYFLLLSCATVFTQEDETACPDVQIRNSAGDCVEPLISRNIYVFSEPVDPEADTGTGVSSPPIVPKLEYNIVFVKAPESGTKPDPIVVPPPQQKTIVYVLSKKGEIKQKVIEYPAGPKQKPEVYYVNYAEGENPELPVGGVDLQTALDAVAELDREKFGAHGAVEAPPATEPNPVSITPEEAHAPQTTFSPASEVPAIPSPTPETAPPAIFAPSVTASPATIITHAPASEVPAISSPTSETAQPTFGGKFDVRGAFEVL